MKSRIIWTASLLSLALVLPLAACSDDDSKQAAQVKNIEDQVEKDSWYCFVSFVLPSSLCPSDFARGDMAYKAKKYEKAVIYWSRAAKAGDIEAQLNLAFMYQKGRDIEKDSKKSLYWYRKAADAGNTEAQIKLGGMLSPLAALKWYRKAADAGSADAQQAMGSMYQSGRGVLKDEEKALNWYKKAARNNNFLAQKLVAEAYEKGLGVEKDNAEALRLYLKLAEQDISEEEYVLDDPDGLNRHDDDNKKRHVSNTEGVLAGQYKAGKIYENGEEGVKKDDEQAVKFYHKAAVRNHSEAQLALGRMYAKGQGIKKDDGQAVRWYRRAAQRGNAEAAYYLYLRYRDGRGVKKNAKTAQTFFDQAIKGGYKAAKAKVADAKAKAKVAKAKVAAAKATEEQLKAFMSAKGISNIYAKNKDGETLLHIALQEGLDKIAVLLIAKGANVNVDDGTGHTPLHRAAEKGYDKVVVLLIAKGANINAAAPGHTPLYEAVYGNHSSTTAIIRRAGGK